MVKQSRATTILLTRPAAQSLRFAKDLELVVKDVPTMISPLMVPEYLNPPIPRLEYTAVILASTAAAEAARRISAAGVPLPSLAFCVGNKTATAASAVGFQTHSADGAATDLLTLIKAHQPNGPLLFLRGQNTSGDIEENLLLAKIETISIIVYHQIAVQLTQQAADLLRGSQPIIIPLFSTRSATLFHAEAHRVAAKAPLWIAAFSPAIASALPVEFSTQRQVAAHPDSSSMILAIQALMLSGAAS